MVSFFYLFEAGQCSHFWSLGSNDLVAVGRILNTI